MTLPCVDAFVTQLKVDEEPREMYPDKPMNNINHKQDFAFLRKDKKNIDIYLKVALYQNLYSFKKKKILVTTTRVQTIVTNDNALAWLICDPNALIGLSGTGSMGQIEFML